MDSNSRATITAAAATAAAISFGLGYYFARRKSCAGGVLVGYKGVEKLYLPHEAVSQKVYSAETVVAAGLADDADVEDGYDDVFALPPLDLPPHLAQGILSLIGNTPLIRLNSLSDETGCEILGKAEFLNPGGSVKDRIALEMVCDAFRCGRLRAGGVVTEGTAGSTGVSLALVASAYGCQTKIFMPDDAAIEKSEMLRALGADVSRVRPVSIVHPEHMVNLARRAAVEASSDSATSDASCGVATEGERSTGDVDASSGSSSSNAFGGSVTKGVSSSADEAAMATSGGHQGASSTSSPAAPTSALFADQFENPANLRAHLRTGEEIWRQTKGRLHAFVSAAGTGGTIAGVSRALKSRDSSIQVFLVDPPGSSLFNKVKRGVLYTSEEAEGRRLRNPFDTITEGVGINRMTRNFAGALVDDAFKGSDREAVEMASYLVRNEAVFVGSSAAINCVGAVKAARLLGPGHTIVTVLCDGGHRHLSKFHSKEYLKRYGLEPKEAGRSLNFVQ